MKIYIQDSNYNWKEFEYTVLDELSAEFSARKIKVGYNATVGDNAKVGYNATVGDNVELLRGLYLYHDTKHPITYTGNGTVSIGCHNMSITDWLKKYKAVGRKEKYTDAEIVQYGQLLKVVAAFIKAIELATTDEPSK